MRHKIQNAGHITNAKQKWQILEERDQEHEDIRNKTIIDLSNLINALTQKTSRSIIGHRCQ